MMKGSKHKSLIIMTMCLITASSLALGTTVRQRVADTAFEEILGWILSLPGLSKLETRLENNYIQWISNSDNGREKLLFELESMSVSDFNLVFKRIDLDWMPINGSMTLNKKYKYKIGFERHGVVTGQRQLIYDKKLTQILEPAHPLKADNQNSALHIKPYPEDARIRILNIKPIYKEGMMLRPGKYRVELSRSGYKSKVYTIRLTSFPSVFHLAL
ncbi:hypothetical protein [Endozoicomonas sp. 4G]|uniref:hypothetical protein n=1 Tax=Endozoicomonas sp. 4G TaxID=2872754 RepID=UPI0020786DB2|nr:hypothetical protein [Endozoicomonas sp. 4G]